MPVFCVPNDNLLDRQLKNTMYCASIKYYNWVLYAENQRIYSLHSKKAKGFGKMEKVSVIVATFQRSRELRRALDSLAVQTYANMEIILVDDNRDSVWNGKVAAIAADFMQQNPSVSMSVIVNEENHGSAKARNIGIMASTGHYITFLDDDDIYFPDKVRKQVSFMVEGNYDFSITDMYLYNENDKLADRRIRNYLKNAGREDLGKYHMMYHLTGTDTLMFKRDFLLSIGGFGPANVGDEYYLMQRAIEAEGSIGYLPGCDVKAYIHTNEGGVSSGDGKIQGENALYAYKKAHFHKIDKKSRRYIRLRHYAVIAFAELRRKRIIPFVRNASVAFLCDPIQCAKLVIKRRF